MRMLICVVSLSSMRVTPTVCRRVLPVTCYLIGLGTSINFFMDVFGRDFDVGMWLRIYVRKCAHILVCAPHSVGASVVLVFDPHHTYAHTVGPVYRYACRRGN